MVREGRALGGIECHLCGGGVGSALLRRVVREAQTGLVAAIVLGAELIFLHERLHVRAVEKQRVLRAVLTAALIAVEHGAGIAVAHTVEVVGIIGFHIAVRLLTAAGMDDDGVIRQGNAQIVRAQAADAADRLDVVQVAENRHHTGDAALSRNLVDDVCIADADLRLRVDNVIDHDGKRAGIFRLCAQLLAGERSVIRLRFRGSTVDIRFFGFRAAAGADEQRCGKKTCKYTFQNRVLLLRLVHIYDTRLAEDCQINRGVLQ